MIKTESTSGSAGKRPSSPQTCWEVDSDPRGVRIELPDGRMTVFPYIHLVFACLEPVAEQETILIRFTSHEVELRGHHLNKLLLALQRQTVDWVRPLPVRYGSLESDRGWVVFSEVREIDRDAALEERLGEVASESPS